MPKSKLAVFLMPDRSPVDAMVDARMPVPEFVRDVSGDRGVLLVVNHAGEELPCGNGFSLSSCRFHWSEYEPPNVQIGPS